MEERYDILIKYYITDIIKTKFILRDKECLKYLTNIYSIEKILINIIDYGYLKIAKELYHNENINMYIYVNHMIKNNRLDIFKWSYSLRYIDKSISEYAFRWSCKNGHLEMAKQIYSLEYMNIDVFYMDIPRGICSNNHFKVARWLYSIEKKFGENKNIFRRLCDDNQVKMAIWLYSLGNIDIHMDHIVILWHSCKNGYLGIAKFIYSLGYEDKYNESLFELACENGHLKIAKWLYSFGNIILKGYYEIMLKNICENGHFAMAKWVYSFKTINLDLFYTFIQSCITGNLAIAKWLNFIEDIDIHYNNDIAFNYSCINGHFDVIKWLYSLGNVNIYDEYALQSTCENGHIEIVKWLYSLKINKRIFQSLYKINKLKIDKWLYSIPNIHYNFIFKHTHLNTYIVSRPIYQSILIINKKNIILYKLNSKNYIKLLSLYNKKIYKI